MIQDRSGRQQCIRVTFPNFILKEFEVGIGQFREKHGQIPEASEKLLLPPRLVKALYFQTGELLPAAHQPPRGGFYKIYH